MGSWLSITLGMLPILAYWAHRVVLPKHNEQPLKKVLAKWNEIVNAKWVVDVVIFHIENFFEKKLAKKM